jgi:hypothetical protein
VTADGARVVYRAYRLADARIELFAVPVDGSAPPARLSGDLVAGGDVAADFRLDPTGTRAFFRADALVDERHELFVAPLDGAAAPVRLSGELVEGGDVLGTRALSAGRAFELTLDGARVVYRADQAVDEVAELWSVPADGSASPVRVGAPLVLGRAVLEEFRIAPDGQQVVYVADLSGDNAFELWVARIDGAPESHRVNGALVPGGDVLRPFYFTDESATLPAFEIAPDSRSVLYVADQEVDEAFELFRAPLARPVLRAPEPTAIR